MGRQLPKVKNHCFNLIESEVPKQKCWLLSSLTEFFSLETIPKGLRHKSLLDYIRKVASGIVQSSWKSTEVCIYVCLPAWGSWALGKFVSVSLVKKQKYLTNILNN